MAHSKFSRLEIFNLIELFERVDFKRMSRLPAYYPITGVQGVRIPLTSL